MRLLSRTIRYYFFYSFVILLIAVPLFYVIIRQIVTDDVDKDLFTQKEMIVRRLDKAVVYDPFDLLENFEPEVNLFRSPTIRLYDTLYTVRAYNRLTREVVPYRVLSSNVIIRGEPYVIQLKSSLVNNEDLIRSIVLVQALLLVLIGAGLVLINRGLTKQVWNPFYKTLQRLQGYKIEKAEELHFDKSEVDEFNDLNNTIGELTRRNRQVYQSQKEFTENAAHEMQTPLAVLQTKLELLMQTQPLTPEQAALITDLADTNSRLSRLHKSLLLLTKIENNQYPETEDIDLIDVCKKVVAQVSDEAEVQDIKIETLFGPTATVNANPALIEILISNLLSNAIRHNHAKGKIIVTCNNRQLMVQNTGPAAPLDAQKIFDRFHKEGSNSRSIGLGLAIVKRIAALYNFDVNYTFQDQLHTFTVGPLSPKGEAHPNPASGGT